MPAVAGASNSPSGTSPSSAAASSGVDSKRRFPRSTAAIVLLSLALGLFRLGHNDVWFDEAASLYFARQPIGSFLGYLLRHDTHGPLYYAFLKGWTALLGEQEWLCRLPSAICGAATVWLTVRLGTRAVSRQVGLTAGALLAVAPHHIYYAQEIRFYALVECMAALNALCFTELIVNEDPAWRTWLGFVLSALGFLLAFYMSMLLLVAETLCLAVLWRRLTGQRRRVVTAFAAVGLLFALWLPWLLWQVRHTTGSIAWIPAVPAWRFVPKLMRVFVGGEHARWTSNLAAAIFSAAALVGVVRNRNRPMLVLDCWLVVPLALAMALSVRHPLGIARYYLMLLPAFYVLVAAGVWRHPRLGTVLGSVAVVAVVVADVHYYRTPKFSERWRDAATYVHHHASPGDVVAGYPQHQIAELTYYFPQANVRGVGTAGDLNELLDPSQRVWLLSSAKDLATLAPWLSPQTLEGDHRLFGTLELRCLRRR